VHARQCVDGRDPRQLERLCRYITRPPVAQDRLERLAEGRLELLEGRDARRGARKDSPSACSSSMPSIVWRDWRGDRIAALEAGLVAKDAITELSDSRS
jgi:Putative transposase